MNQLKIKNEALQCAQKINDAIKDKEFFKSF